jgi:hypothetical protein
MEQPEFEITIAPDGKVRVHVTGVSGERCLEYADMIREIVGREESRDLTREYYAPDGSVRIGVQQQIHVREPPGV